MPEQTRWEHWVLYVEVYKGGKVFLRFTDQTLSGWPDIMTYLDRNRYEIVSTCVDSYNIYGGASHMSAPTGSAATAYRLFVRRPI